MKDALRTGAERLERWLCREDDYEDETPMSEFFASDPGIKALVEFAETFKGVSDGASTEEIDAAAVLKLWEHGK